MEAILLINNETLVCLFSGKIEELGSEFSKRIESGEKEKATVHIILLYIENDKSKIFRENNLQRTLVMIALISRNIFHTEAKCGKKYYKKRSRSKNFREINSFITSSLVKSLI